MCRQLVLAMKHVASLKLAHGDLAARNLLLTYNFDIKLSNASLCVDVFSREYIVHRRRPLPLRWAAPETVITEAGDHHATLQASTAFKAK